jgi:hypothetical protein
MQSTRRLPYIGLQGGGVPAGGTLHAGHAYWESTITPVAAAPQLYPAPPEPSLYVTPTPRDLPAIVARPYKLLKGGNRKIGGPLDDGFTRVAVVGEPGPAELYADEAMGREDITKNIEKTFQNYRQPEGYRTESSVRERPISVDSPSTIPSHGSYGLVRGGFGIDLNNDPMEIDLRETRGGEMYTTQEPNDPSSNTMVQVKPQTAPVTKQKPYRHPKLEPVLNSADILYNIEPETLNQQLNASINFNNSAVAKQPKRITASSMDMASALDDIVMDK